MVQDARKFLLSSDYPMDIVVWANEGETAIHANSWKTISIAHGLSFKPLFFGIYSIDGGNTWVALDMEISSGAALYPNADSTNINIEIHSRINGTLKYKLWAYEPSDSTSTTIPPASENPFKINSDSDYLKVVKTGIWQAEQGVDLTIYEHGLGYTPWVMMWLEMTDGSVQLPLFVVSSDTTQVSNRYAVVDDNSLRANFSSLVIGDHTLSKIHYRIYADRIGG